MIYPSRSMPFRSFQIPSLKFRINGHRLSSQKQCQTLLWKEYKPRKYFTSFALLWNYKFWDCSRSAVFYYQTYFRCPHLTFQDLDLSMVENIAGSLLYTCYCYLEPWFFFFYSNSWEICICLKSTLCGFSFDFSSSLVKVWWSKEQHLYTCLYFCAPRVLIWPLAWFPRIQPKVHRYKSGHCDTMWLLWDVRSESQLADVLRICKFK
jgi:hypothetical protein